MVLAQTECSLHEMLVLRTNDAHQALHHHPSIGQLLTSDLTPERYLTIMLAYQSFFAGAEDKRQQLKLWQQFSLQVQVQRLRKDISVLLPAKSSSKKPFEAQFKQSAEGRTKRCQNSDFSWMTGRLPCLSVLYVMHGSAFGAKLMAKYLRKSLPELPHYFFSGGIDEGNWRLLIQSLNKVVSNDEQFECLVASVNQTYQRFGNWVRV